ncbi:MAG: peptidylprolyl isomerase [Alphaproteobacteria bacterium]|nr:peptidylprolyl isomerase [Alphaproteobacteria bacterium]
MKKLLLGTLCFFALSVNAGNLRAIVNDVPVSEWDVKMHARLLKAQQPAVYEGMGIQKLNKAALDNLIEEILKTQKGKDLNITLSEKEVDDAILHLEQQNGLSAGGLKRLLDEAGVSMKALRKQVYGDLIWLQYVRSKSNQVANQVPESAVKDRLKKIKADMSKPSYTVAEIVVPSLEEAQSIWEKLQANEGSFSEMAQKFSTSKTASAGGRVGVIDENYYGKDVAPILREMPVGQLSRPLAIKGGYAILVMIDKKSAITTDSIMLWELAQGGQKEGATYDSIMAADNCQKFIKELQKEGVPESIQQGWTDPAQLPDELKDLMTSAAVNEVVGPVRVPQGQLFFMKCNVRSQRVIPTIDEVRNQLEMEQMELLSRRLLEAEKRKAVIEYKE